MKKLLGIATLMFWAGWAQADIVVPGANGTDGALIITNNTVIDLSLSTSGLWDNDNSANVGNGTYDSNKWAVVFKYTEVNIASGVNVTFKNHPSRAPVVWLVQSNVVIDGTVSLDGGNNVGAPHLSEPGPGGFRGGIKDFSAGVSKGPGFGPGGGFIGGAGLYQNKYGNPSNIPLIGGSGGAGNSGNSSSWGYRNYSGGAGGGAMLIAAGQSVSVEGSLQANGGEGGDDSRTGYDGGSGSGGAIRLVCDTLNGSGSITATGGTGGHDGEHGRIRIERVTNNGSFVPTPAPSIVDLLSSSTALLWPPSGSPEVRIVSIGAEDAPSDPRSAFGTDGADLVLPVTSSATVIVETINVETSAVVNVRMTPRDTYNATVVQASLSQVVTNAPLTVLWNATVPANKGYSAVQVQVIRP